MRFVVLARALVLGASVAAGGCGEGLVPADAYSRPLLTFGGVISPPGGLAMAIRPRLGVLWTDPTQAARDVPSSSSYLSSRVDAANDAYGAELFRPPPASALVDISTTSGDVAQMAFGDIVIFDDADGDGTFFVSGSRAEITPPDVFLAAAGRMIRYVSRPFAAPEPTFPLGTAAAPGYVLLGVSCNGPLLVGITPLTAASDLTHVDLTALPGQTLPEVRSCARSHSP